MESNTVIPMPPAFPKLPSAPARRKSIDERHKKFIFKKSDDKDGLSEQLLKKKKKTEDLHQDSFKEGRGGELFDRHDEQTHGKIQCETCKKWTNHDLFDSHMQSHVSEIEESWLYLGGAANAMNRKELLERKKINCIINACTEVGNYFPKEIEYLNIQLEDLTDQNILDKIEEAVEFLVRAKEEGKKVLVHCVQGASRSASIIIAYYMKVRGYTLKEAYNFVNLKRKIVRPNPGFIQQLGEYEQRLMREKLSLLEGDQQFIGEVSLKAEDVWCKCQLPPLNKPVCVCNMN